MFIHNSKNGLTKNRLAFTVVEILIASSVLSMLMIGLFALFSGGQRIGGQTLWLQNTVGQLRNAARQINTSIDKATYPALIDLPRIVVEREIEDFFIHYYSNELFATDTVTFVSRDQPASVFLALTQSAPARRLGMDSQPAELIYHIFSLCNDGDLHYQRFSETVAADDVENLSRSSIPPATANLVNYSILVNNVLSVMCSPTQSTDTSPLMVRISTIYPRGDTIRRETAIGTPNVQLRAHNIPGGW